MSDKIAKIANIIWDRLHNGNNGQNITDVVDAIIAALPELNTHRGDDVHPVEAAMRDDGWHKVGELKPKFGQKVWTYWGGDKLNNPVLIKNEYNPKSRELGSSDWWYSRPDQTPTHWMPLPDAPTEGE